MSIQILVGLIVIFGAIYLVAKKREPRLVLFLAGTFMAVVAGEPMAGFKAFSAAIANSRLLEPIVASMGFAFVLKCTKCDEHLVHLLAKGLKKAGPVIVPGAVLVTAFINTSVTSASGCSAAVGAILIPLLMKSGVHPAMAGAAVFAGTYGSPHLNPGFAQVIVVAEATKNTPMAIIANHATVVILTSLVVAGCLAVVSYLRKENSGYAADVDEVNVDFKVSLLKAIVPTVPLILLLLGSTKVVPALSTLGISHAMIIGSALAWAATRESAEKIAKEFFHGFGESFGHIFGLITCSLVFVGGMEALGMVKALVSFMKTNPDLAKISGVVGPFLLGMITGSGDAASIAFNTAVTPNAAAFGLDPMNLGSTAAVSAALGRTMSPIAGVCIICAGYAGVNPMELAKRNVLSAIVGAVFFTVMMLYLR